MSVFDEQLDQTRKQIERLREQLADNGRTLSVQRQLIKNAQEAIVELVKTDTCALYELPRILQSLTDAGSVGAVLFGPDGRMLMHTAGSKSLFPIDSRSLQPNVHFYDEDTEALLSNEQLPWLRTEKTTTSLPVKVLCRTSENSEPLHIEVSTVALHKNGAVSGVLAFCVDRTELMRAGKTMEKLCQQAEQQERSIKLAEQKLNSLSDLLAKSMTEKSVVTPPATPAKTTPRSSSGKVLVADDVAIIRRVLALQLANLGVDTMTASNGREAADLCKKHRFALVLMDCDMPVLNGFKATAEIREHERAAAIHTPIVAMTSFDREGDAEECFSSGMDEHLPKGSSQARLRQIVDKYILGKSRSPDTESPACEIYSLDSPGFRKAFGPAAEDLVSSFFATVEPMLNCLGFAVEVKDTASVVHFAIALKGPCELLGAGTIASSASRLIGHAEEGNWDEARCQLQDLKETYLRRKTAIAAK